MARAPETGFYFEPISERLVLVVEGFPFPSDDFWAYVGDPVEMTQELARLMVATRWPDLIKAIATWMAVVDLPEPPFSLPTTMT